MDLYQGNDIILLQDANVTKLKSFEFSVTDSRLSMALFLDLARRNSGTLTSLYITSTISIQEVHGTREEGVYLPLNAFGLGSSLTDLSLCDVCVTRDAFSSMLQSCPSLQNLSLLNTMAVAYTPSLQLFRHHGLKSLSASFSQVQLIDYMASVEFIVEFCDNVFDRLESCSFKYKGMSPTVMLSLLEHQASLTSIPHLQCLSATEHIMDVSLLEGHELVCCDTLKELRVRFSGLRTAAAVNNCLNKLSTGKTSGTSLTVESDEGDELNDERICCQLMRFKKLKTVWLGTKEYYLPTQ
ncbi:hypothetical protein BGZ47_011015 [Haplosporangium gracile]|nr:hypothetical protein BGZ47_011015 [Haplosporangium gracile]